MAEETKVAVVPDIPFGDPQSQAAALAKAKESETAPELPPMSMEEHVGRLGELGDLLFELNKTRYRHEAAFHQLCDFGSEAPNSVSAIVIDTLVNDHGIDLGEMIAKQAELFDKAWQAIGEIADEARQHLAAINQLANQRTIENLANDQSGD